jgi:cytochrome c oxidase subunit 1
MAAEHAHSTEHAAHDDHHHGPPAGIMRWITTTNHKDIGTLYLLFSLTMFFIGGILAMGIRLELFQPGLQFWRPEFFNHLTTLHGLILVFGSIILELVGLV